MSAYVVSHETISVLVKAFEIYGVDYKAENINNDLNKKRESGNHY